MYHKLVLGIVFSLASFFVKAQVWGDSSRKHDIVFSSVEVAPKFPGGISAFYQFVADNLRFPDSKFSRFSNKSLILNILIDKTGSPVYAEVEKGINEDYNKAALAIVSKMPQWKPALQNSKPVSIWVKVPLIFID